MTHPHDCPFEPIAEPAPGRHIYRCPRCHFTTRKAYASPPRRNCPGRPPDPEPEPARQPPPLARQIARYAGAVYHWIRAGRPKRSDAEVARLLALCRACEHYDPAKTRCNHCGCKTTTGPALRNKLRMATQREAESLTGLLVGGISALALLNRGFRVFLDSSAITYAPYIII